MYRSVRGLRDAAVEARDGRVGFEEQVFFDDEKWAVRYLVVDTEGPAGDRSVLVSPMAVTAVDRQKAVIHVDLTCRQVSGSPDIDTERPVSRQKETEYSLYYRYPMYWGGIGLWYHEAIPSALLKTDLADAKKGEEGRHDDVHLRSSREVIGYHVRARDGRIGHVEDFLFDETSWAIAYVEVDTRNWIGGKKVLVPPGWLGRVSWADRRVHIDLPLAAIRTAPAAVNPEDLTPEYEKALREHYEKAKTVP